MVLTLPTYAKVGFNENQLTLSAKQFLSQRSNKENINVIALSAQSANNVVYSSYAYFGSKNKINAQNLFQIGSITKSFIAVILLQLEEEPRYHFTLNQSITDFLPEYKNWHHIKLINLLNMTSGLPDVINNPDFLNEFSHDPYRDYSSKILLDHLYQQSVLFKPGSKFYYSNSNYFLLGLIIEKITGHSLAYEFDKRIRIPLKLNHTFYLNNQNKKQLHFMVHGYQSQPEYAEFMPLGTDVTSYNLMYAGPAAGMISTSVDVLTWVKALFTPGKLLNEKQFRQLTSLVSERTGQPLQKLSAKDPRGYGLGIRAIYYPAAKDKKVYVYEGLTFGYRAIYLYSQSDNKLIVATVNSNYFKKSSNPLFDLINRIYNQMS